MVHLPDSDPAPGRSHIIQRPRLTRLLDETDARVILLVGPAGYGKTTLARQWLDQGGRIGAWYRCTEASADVAAFAIGLARAAAEVIPGAGATMRARLSVTSDPEREAGVLAELLAGDLQEWPANAWLAIDDCHLAAGSGCDIVIKGLADLYSVRLLATTRRQPEWASGRAKVYGGIRAIGPGALAMDIDETHAVLEGRPRAEIIAVGELARGWPAVIGLAASARELRPLAGDVSAALYDYFAEEIFRTIPSEVRWNLCRLSLAPVVTAEVFDAVLEDEAPLVAAAMTQTGFSETNAADRLDLHPLLRSFLRAKLREYPPARVRKAVKYVGTALIRLRRWDDAFVLSQEFGEEQLAETVLRDALDPLLEEGRLATLTRWLEAASSADGPIIRLARAEIAFRTGEASRAATLATEAATRFPREDSMRSRALYLAGAGWYQADAYERALELHTCARAAATEPEDLQNSVWGQFLAAVLLERPEAADLLSEVHAHAAGNVRSAVRIVCGKQMLAALTGDVRGVLEYAAEVAPLVGDVPDPLVRVSFHHAVSRGYSMHASYERALHHISAADEEADHYRLEFVRVNSLTNRAAAETGLRRFDRALAHVDEVEQLARSKRDRHNFVDARIIRARILISQELFDEATAVLQDVPLAPPSRTLQGELLMARALARACAGDGAAAADYIAQARSSSRSADAWGVTAHCVAAVAALQAETGDADALIRRAVGEALSHGFHEPLVLSYRACRDFLVRLVSLSEYKTEIFAIMRNARDTPLARAAGARDIDLLGRPSAPFTRREHEVYALLCEGRTNRQIAEALYISEVTVKAHLRRVFAKLGVKTRTQAALRGTNLDLPRSQ